MAAYSSFLSVITPSDFNLDGIEPLILIGKALIRGIREIALEVNTIIREMPLPLLKTILIMILTDGVVKLYRIAYNICERIIWLILLPSVKWEGAFVISCIAVSLDPLFFYIPIIDETNKCLAVDEKLKNVAVVLRLLTDIPLTIHFIAQLCRKVTTDHPNLYDSDSDPSNIDSDSGASADSDFETPECSLKYVKNRTVGRMRKLPVSVVMNFLAVLPIPQLVIIIGFFRMRGSSGTEVFLQRTFLNVSLVLQYLPRACQIYLSGRHFRMGGIWIQPCLNLFFYIVASHVFSAFWYFFAIERETSCWHQVCRNTPGCVATFDCGGIGNTSLNITALDQLCPINSPNTTVFDFGIYLPVLQSGNTGAVNFFRKLFYSLWWGLRNLSNFGTNLETSTYMWENCFAILICISGLLLFLCLIGSMQKYMEVVTTKSLNSEQSRRKKIAVKRKQIKEWMESNGFAVDMMKRIMKDIKQHRIVQKSMKADVDLDFFFASYRFPSYNFKYKEPMKEFLVKGAVKSVLMLEKMNERGWKTLCGYMKPVIYSENDDIVKEAGQKLDQMIFIIQGKIECTDPMITHRNQLKKGDCYGLRIRNWAAMNYMKSYYDPLPTSTARVKCQTKVEAFALKALDLIRFLEKNSEHLNIISEELKTWAAAHDNTTRHQTHNQNDQHPIEPWKPPERGLVKLNFSVVWDSNSKKAKMGCVCRNDRGGFIVAGSSLRPSPFKDKFDADAWGMATAIRFITQNVRLHKGIVVESDNQDLIDCLKEPNLSTNERISKPLMSVLESISNLTSKFKARHFMYCNPQINTVANLLANREVDSDDPGVSAFREIPPDWLRPALKVDSPDLDTKPDEELGVNNDIIATSPDGAAHDDYKDTYTIIASTSSVRPHGDSSTRHGGKPRLSLFSSFRHPSGPGS